MSKVTVHPERRELEGSNECTLLQLCLNAGINMAHACGGKARCSTCRVLIESGIESCTPRTTEETIIATKLSLSPQIRLACQTRAEQEVRIRRLILDDRDLEIAGQEIHSLQISPAGEEKHIAIMFCDVRGFTEFSETLSAYDVIHTLNRYHALIVRVLAEHSGQVENYMGDGVLAVFGLHPASDSEELSCRNAVRAGLEILDQVAKNLSPCFLNLYQRDFQIGIGIHFGSVVYGNVGHGISRRNTIIGDAVNFASRIEKANKQTGTKLLVSDAVARRVGDEFRLSHSYEVTVQGKQGNFQLHEVERVPEIKSPENQS
jgi:adenylate cyclase